MFQPPLRWIGDTSHHGALAMQLHLHCPHQLCHPSCIVMLVIMVVVLIMTLIRMRVGVTLICSTILILRTRPLPFIPIMAPIIPPFASQSAQPELGCKHKFNISFHKILQKKTLVFMKYFGWKVNRLTLLHFSNLLLTHHAWHHLCPNWRRIGSEW